VKSAASYLSDVDRHLDNARAHIAVAESGDAKRAAYEQAADEIVAAMATDETLTQVEVGRRIGKGRTWVQDLIAWRRARRDGLPFAHGRDVRYRERKVPTEHVDRVEMAAKLLADPEVAKGVLETPAAARSVVRQAIADQDADDREQARQARERRQKATAVPLPALFATMVRKIDDWVTGLRSVPDDALAELDGHPRDLVYERVDALRVEVDRWLRVLEEFPALDELPVIELAPRRARSA
jgi:hypothetical protein